MAYSYLTTQNLYILQCHIYGTSIAYPMLRISRHLEKRPTISTHVSRVFLDLRLSDKECKNTCSYSTCQECNGQCVTYFLRFSDPKKLCLKYTDFSTTYLSGQLPRKTYHFKGNQRIQRYTENTLHRRKMEMVNAPLLVQQFTHPVHPNSSYRLSHLLRQFVDKTGKIRKRQQTKHKRKTSKTVHTGGKHYIFQKSNHVNMTGPDQTACSAR